LGSEPTYDIFSGASDGEALWQCSVEGLRNAEIRMEQLAAKKPGRYFVYSTRDQAVVASIDTTSTDAKRSGGVA
jgi:hypothetical protein